MIHGTHNVFQVVFVHLIYNSASFLASWCCSFLIHVTVNLLCVFLGSRQLVLLSVLPTLFIPSAVKWMCPAVLLKNFILINVTVFYLFIWGSKFRFHIEEWGGASALYTFILESFWTKVGLKVLFRIPSIWKNSASFCWISFHFHGKFHNRDI